MTPRGYGRARSVDTDPRLALYTKAVVDKTNTGLSIFNLEEILYELESMKAYTHGNGQLYASVCTDFDFNMGNNCAKDFVHRGSMIYSAFMPGNSNCSRFVESVLIAGLNPASSHRKSLIIHETIVSSPISNVVNASYDGNVYIVDNGSIETKPMTRSLSRAYFLSQTIANFRKEAALELPTDQHPGYTNEPDRPVNLPESAQWLGGIGEGAWFEIKVEMDIIKLVKYDHNGNAEYQRLVDSHVVDWKAPLNVDYDTHASKLTVRQDGKKISIKLSSYSSDTQITETPQPIIVL